MSSSAGATTEKTRTIHGPVADKPNTLSGWPLKVFNKFSVEIPADTWLIAGYCLNENRWYAVAANCPA